METTTQLLQYGALFLGAVFAVSTFTGLTVQAIKKLLGEFKKKIGTNLLASIVAIVLSAALAAGFAIVKDVTVDAVYIVYGLALAFVSWLCAMLGYDKVKQALEQTFFNK